MDRLRDERVSFVTHNRLVQSTLRSLPKIAQADISVLITGESGTGKEIIANLIHRKSGRARKNFVAVNCSAIPTELLEAELFGYKKGAFTGACGDRHGLFETAEGGTVFLDEIGDMPVSLQAKILRVLQEKMIRPLGGGALKPVDFRLISATHKSLHEEIGRGNFREDLYYRLNGVLVHLPPLRERPEDISVLTEMFASAFAKKYSLPPLRFSAAAMEKMLKYSWPGNVRQLENLVEQMSILHNAIEVVEPGQLPFSTEPVKVPLKVDEYFCQDPELPTVSQLTDRYIQFVFDRVHHHQGQAAKILGLSRRTIYRKTQIPK